jgi:hypothetical protein
MSASTGYIKLHRSLLQHPLILQLPAAWFRIWLVILFRASWKSSSWWDGIKEVDVPAGAFVTSLKNLAKASGATEQQVRGALKYFDATQMVTRATTNHHTKITVINWDVYQTSAETDNSPPNAIRNISTPSQRQVNNNSIRISSREVSSTVLEEPIPENVKLQDWGVINNSENL